MRDGTAGKAATAAAVNEGDRTMADKRVTGPIQVFVIGFDDFKANGRIMAELQKVRKRGVLRVIDVLFV